MGHLGLWLLALAAGQTQAASILQCCKEKSVGGVAYTLVDETDTGKYGCKSNCVFEKMGSPGSRFCFKEGDLEVVCDGDDYEAGGCKCGVKKTSRIVGGQETEVNEYPWMAALAENESGDENFFCGGTLIGDQWVVTASHCLFKDRDGLDPLVSSELIIVLGEHDTADIAESQIPRKAVSVMQIITHENYDPANDDNDVALLKLGEPVDLDVYTPACVAESGDDFVGDTAWVYGEISKCFYFSRRIFQGWGYQSSGGVAPEKLLEVDVEIVSQDVCKLAMAGYDITDGMLCAGGVAGKDGCQGDSGGPLTVDVDGQHTLVGDVSWGNGCGFEDQYGVYAKTSFYRNWIDTNIEANGGIEFCP